MRDRPFFDTNVILYFLSREDIRSTASEALLSHGGCISVQVLNEFAEVAHRKLKMPWSDIQECLSAVRALCELPFALTVATHETALRIANRYKYHIYDATILASALEAGCNVLYSEDMQNGQRIDSLTIRNPFL